MVLHIQISTDARNLTNRCFIVLCRLSKIERFVELIRSFTWNIEPAPQRRRIFASHASGLRLGPTI